MSEERLLRLMRCRPWAAVCVAGLLVGGCGGSSALSSAGSQDRTHVNGEWGLEDTRAAIALLNAGRPAEAREKLIRALQARPGDTIARSLLRQIDTDPKELLGTGHHGYVVRQGDTMSGLAQRFLGDPLMSYALARYNGLSSPLAIAPGQSLRIPGKAKAPVVTRKSEIEPAKSGASPTASAARPDKPAKPAAHPATAARLRGQGLAAMNSGAINRAVALLRQALAHDPDNGLIRNDLTRALRVQATLGGRP